MDLVPIRILAIAGRDKIDKGARPLWQDRCLWVDGIDIKLGPFIIRQDRLQQAVIDCIVMQKIRQAGYAESGNRRLAQNITIAG